MFGIKTSILICAVYCLQLHDQRKPDRLRHTEGTRLKSRNHEVQFPFTN